MRLEPWHVVVLIVVVMLLFGANRLPAMAKSVGQSLKIFKNEMQDLTKDDTRTTDAAAKDDKPSDDDTKV